MREEKEQEEEEEEQWEVGDLFLPQYLTRLSSAGNNITAGFCGNLACSRTRTYWHIGSTCCGGKLNVFRSKLQTFILLKEKKGSKERWSGVGLDRGQGDKLRQVPTNAEIGEKFCFLYQETRRRLYYSLMFEDKSSWWHFELVHIHHLRLSLSECSARLFEERRHCFATF